MALTKINTNLIANNTIAVTNIADNAIDATKIASNSILTRHIDDDQITGDQLTDNIAIAGTLGITGTTTAAAINSTGHITSTLNGATLTIRSTGNSPAVIDLRADGTSDPKIYFDLNGTTNIAMGVDNSDGDNFKISNNYALGTNDRFVITPAGAVTIPGTLGVTGAITGNVTGNASGTAATVTGAAQTAITSVGTLSSLAVGNITTTGYLAGPASFVIDPTTVGDNTGTVVIAGSLQVDGTTTTINSTTLTVDDLKITVAEGAGSSSAANEAGIEVGVGAVGASSNPSILYTHATTSWDLNKPVNVTGAFSASGAITGTLATAAQTNITSLGTLTTLTVDDITINSSTISDAGEFTLDVGGDIILDADAGGVYFKDGGTEIGLLANTSTNFVLMSRVNDKDIIFKGKDGSSTITALTLDMSDAGTASFNNDIKVADDNNYYAGSSNELAIYHTGSGNSIISHSTSASGAMYIDAGGTLNIRNSTGGGENMIVAAGDGAVTLYYDNAAKLATASGGVNVTGNLASSSIVTAGTASSAGIGAALADANVSELGRGYLSLGRDDTADAAQISFSKNGVAHTNLVTTNNDFVIRGAISNLGLRFEGNDGGSNITALRLDIANAGAAAFNSTVTATAATLSSSTNMLLTLNPTAGNYGGILFKYDGTTKGSSIFNSGNMVYGGEASVGAALQAGGQYGLFVHPTTRNVGIGNGLTAPSYKLEVTGTLGVTDNAYFAGNVGINNVNPSEELNIRADSGHLRLSGATTTTKGLSLLFDNANNRSEIRSDQQGVNQLNLMVYGLNQYFGRNSSSITMTLTDGNKVGIGTTSPENTLEVNGDIALDNGSSGNSGKLYFGVEHAGSNVNSAKQIKLSSYYMTYVGHQNEGHKMVMTDASGNYQQGLEIYGSNNAKASQAIFYSGGSGKLGVNVGTPEASFHAKSATAGQWAGKIENSATGGAGLLITSAGSQGSEAILDVRNGDITSVFKIMNDNGRVEFQAQHTGDSRPGDWLFSNEDGIDGAGANTSFLVENGNCCAQILPWSTNGVRIGARTGGWSTQGSNNTYITGGADAVAAYAAGSNFYLGNGTQVTSDERLKENIVTIADGQLAKINALRPVTFDWIQAGKGSAEGLIAQEVETVIPEAVGESHFPADPSDDSRTFTDTNIKSINDSVLTARLIKAVQELSAELTAAKARITTLEG